MDHFQLKPYEPDYILAEQDQDGVNPEYLRAALENYKKTGNKMPKVRNIKHNHKENINEIRAG